MQGDLDVNWHEQNHSQAHSKHPNFGALQSKNGPKRHARDLILLESLSELMA